ncbi:MAG: engB [Nevskia sp.]|nr:engB [Nevskia sp.]
MASPLCPIPPLESAFVVNTPPPFNPFRQAQFVLSAARLMQLPKDHVGEAAFVGRSNAGKSSALNKICDQHGLARVSKTPGRTQLINLFVLPSGHRLVDLPGYGFAQAPLEVKRAWNNLVGGFMEHRPNLRGVVVVMDIRHPLTDLDWQMLEWTRSRDCATHILLTKADKLGFGAMKTTVREVETALRERAYGVTVQAFSSVNGLGLETVRATVDQWLKDTPPVAAELAQSLPL